MNAIAVLPDGKRALTCSADGTVRLWEVATGRELAVLVRDVGISYPLIASPDGKHFAFGTYTKAFVYRLEGIRAVRYGLAGRQAMQTRPRGQTI